VGPISRRITLRADDRDHIAPFHAAYFDLIEQISDIPIGNGVRSVFEKTADRYRHLDPGAFAPDVPRDASPLAVRALLEREREALRIATAGIRRASRDPRRLEGELSGKGAREP